MKFKIATIVTLILLALLFLFVYQHYWFWNFFAAILLMYIGSIVNGSFNIQANYFLRAHHKLSTNEILFTFDDGPNPEYTPKILAILKANNIKAIFFLIGKEVEKHPEIVKQIVAEGHVIGNHSYSHSNSFGFFSTKKVKEDLSKAQLAIQKIIGVPPKLFRPPVGVTNPNIAKAIKELKFKTIGWNLRTLDTVTTDKQKLINKISTNLKPGSIVLFHDTQKVTLQALPEIIELCRKKGMQFANISNKNLFQ